MERTKFHKCKIPDAIHCGVSKEFTQVPKSLLRNPLITGKAKAILCLLLSNKEGWYSCVPSIVSMMKEGDGSVRAGIAELEKHEYLQRVKYRDKKSKTWQGSFWAYTDQPGKFDMEEQLNVLDQENMEACILKNPDMENPDMENSRVIIIYNNNNKKNLLPAAEHITPSMFEQFWEAYPKKIDKGKALTAWNKICSSQKNNKPSIRTIKKAIIQQKKTERWQDSKYIPHPTTWLNQSRWLDDPKEMIEYPRQSNNPLGSRQYSKASMEYVKHDKVINNQDEQ